VPFEKRRQKEARFARDVNHWIAKKLVRRVQAPVVGSLLKDLKGIRAGNGLKVAESSTPFFGKPPTPAIYRVHSEAGGGVGGLCESSLHQPKMISLWVHR
jgi:hypothetical protein